MNINRHNYEEFFLLYVDNELTAAQRKIVDAFVAVNPDLQQEFLQLQQTILTTDAKLDHHFISSLLKPVDEESSISEEQLLLYIDNELRADEKAAVEKELLTKVSLQKELQWLRRSQVTADTSIVFPNKSLLYKEAAPARVFYMSTVARRWAAAAAVILLMGSAIWLMLDKPSETVGPVAAINPSVGTEEKQSGTTVIQNTEKQPQEYVAVEPEIEKQLTTANANKNNSTLKITQAVTIAKTDSEKIKQQINTSTEQPNTIAAGETPVTVNPEKISTPVSNKIETPTVQPIASTASTTSYASYNNDSDTEDEQTLFNEDRQRRSGLTGFVKKAKRMFERKTGIQSNDSEVRFAMFAVNTQ